jgi:hypothetical protein
MIKSLIKICTNREKKFYEESKMLFVKQKNR